MLLLWILQMAVTNDHCQSTGLEVTNLLLGFKMGVKGMSLYKHACVHACVLTHTQAHEYIHTQAYGTACAHKHTASQGAMQQAL